MSLVLALLGVAMLGGQPGISADRQRQLVAEYANCVVKRMPRKAKAVVLSDRDSGAAVARYDEVLSPDCMPLGENDGSMTMRTWPFLIRVSLAQALVQAEPSLGLPPLATVPPLEHGTPAKPSSKDAALGIAMSRVGECVVRTAPEPATELIRADVASPAEAAAFEAVKPALSSCLSAGETFAFSPELLRGAVALNYYRLAKAGEKK